MDKQVTDIILAELAEVKKDVKFLLEQEHRRAGMVYIVSGIVSLIIALGSKFL